MDVFQAFNEMSEEDRQLAMFGMTMRNGKWVPLLKREYRGIDACQSCKGFGTGGNPLCGAVYTCKACNGEGKRKSPPSLLERFLYWAGWRK